MFLQLKTSTFFRLQLCLFLLILVFAHSAVFAQQQKNYSQVYLDLIKNKNEDKEKIDSLLDLSFVYQAKNLDTAIFLSAEAVRIAKKINQPESLVNAWIQMASNYSWQEQYDTSIYIYNDAINSAINNKYVPQLIKAYRNLADVYALTEVWESAFKYSIKALELAEKNHDEKEIAYAHHELSAVYMGTNDYEDAEIYLIKAANYFKAHLSDFKLKDRYATCLSELGKLNFETGNYIKATPYIDSAIVVFNSLDAPLQNAEAYKLLGDIYTELNNISKATQSYNYALKVFEGNKKEAYKYQLFPGLSKLAIKQKNFIKAKELLEEAYEWSAKHLDDELEMSSLAGLIKVDSALGITTQVFKLISEYQRIADIVYRVKHEQYTRRLEMQFKSETIEKENETLRKEKDQAVKQFIVSTIIGVVFLVFLSLLYLLYQQKQQINKELLVAQQQALESNNELTEINKAKDKLFSILSHDLRTPLSNTLQLLQLTKNGEILQDDFKHLADYLESGLSYNASLLDNLLNWAKGQMGGFIISMSKINLLPVSKEICTLFEMICTQKKIKLKNAIPEGLTVVADENVLRLAFRNIISNATKFSKVDTDIMIEAIEVGNKVQIIFRDKGIGISPEQIQKIFSFDIKSTFGTQKEKGAGIGLRITYEMLQQMGGKIWFESKLGEGTSVFLEVDKAV